MALEEQMKEAPVEEDNRRLTEEEETDLTIMVRLAENLIDDGGIDIINQALESSSDPAQVIGQFLFQLPVQMEENFPEGFEISKRIFLAKGGWLEQVSDFLQEEYDVPKEIMDRAEIYVASTAQQLHGPKQQQPPGAPAPAQAPAQPAPIVPQGGAY